jgi:hypothetical protein
VGFDQSLEVGIDGRGCEKGERGRAFRWIDPRLMGKMGVMPRARDRIPQSLTSRVITHIDDLALTTILPLSPTLLLKTYRIDTLHVNSSVFSFPISTPSFSHPYAKRQVPESRRVFGRGCARTPLFSTSSIWGVLY